MYPLGVAAELLCMWDAKNAVSAMEPVSGQPWTILMPNASNFEFKFSWMVWLCYASYVPGFPMLFCYMLAQRKRFYLKVADKQRQKDQ